MAGDGQDTTRPRIEDDADEALLVEELVKEGVFDEEEDEPQDADEEVDSTPDDTNDNLDYLPDGAPFQFTAK